MTRRAVTRRLTDAYSQKAALFNGTNQYLSLVEASTGLTDSTTGTVIFGIKLTADSKLQYIFHTPTNKFYLDITAANKINIVARNTSNTIVLNKITSAAAITADSAWHTVMCSFDMTNELFNMYVDGVSTAVDAGTLTQGETVEMTRDLYVGAASTPSDYLDGALSNLAISTEYLDLTDSTVRDAIVSTTSFLDPGATGTNWFAAQPAILLQGRGALFNANSGSGDDFTVTAPPLKFIDVV